MDLRIYWELRRKYGLKCSEKWYEEVPDKVRKSGDGTIKIWGIEIWKQCNRWKGTVRMLLLLIMERWLIVDFSVPCDTNVSGN